MLRVRNTTGFAGCSSQETAGPSAAEWAAAVKVLGLTPRQPQVVVLVLQARKDKQIATELGLTISTVRMHLRRAFCELRVRDRMELALKVVPMLCARCRGEYTPQRRRHK